MGKRPGREKGGFCRKAVWALIAAILLLTVCGCTPAVENTDGQREEHYQMATVAPTEADLTEIMAHYATMAEVVSSVSISKAGNVPAEEQLSDELTARGFNQSPIIYTHTADGDYLGEQEIGTPSQEKHPSYETYYSTANGDVWQVLVINDRIMATPLFYNLSGEASTAVVLSENETIASYDSATDYFFELLPYEGAVKVITVDRIDAAALEQMTMEVISSYE